MMIMSTGVFRPVTRRSKRYIVKGSAVLQTPSGESAGALLNLGQGGMLVRTDVPYKKGTELALRFHVGGSSPETITALGEVVGAKEDLLAIKFLKKPTGIEFLLDWLDLQHCLWSGIA